VFAGLVLTFGQFSICVKFLGTWREEGYNRAQIAVHRAGWDGGDLGRDAFRGGGIPMGFFDGNWFSCDLAASYFADDRPVSFPAILPAKKETMSPLTIHQLVGRRCAGRSETNQNYLYN